MWREYFGFVAPALAVINGFIAILISMLPIRRSVAKLRLGVTALIIGALAIGAGYYAKYAARSQNEQQQSLRDQVREDIQTRILEGRTLLGQIRDAQRELPARPADEWALRSENYLRDRLGERYVARFRKEANDLYGDAAIPGPRMGYWRAVRNRVVALELIASELTEPPDVMTPAPPVAAVPTSAPAPAPSAATPAPAAPASNPVTTAPASR
ncbi:hypothetical protein [Rhodoplanes sp. Z2-YC6860]|uniref:hypothetical protein n=1 Tax=Rhodoplanes sp. Z2-YC6860 TaxID=674703 RepID=UPI0012EDC3BC|nr:hypothetical protein [Rhodoplanes sp. Z2-YC6860]